MAGYGIWVTEGSGDTQTSRWWTAGADQLWSTYDEWVAKHQAKYLTDRMAGAGNISFESKMFEDPSKTAKAASKEEPKK